MAHFPLFFKINSVPAVQTEEEIGRMYAIEVLVVDNLKRQEDTYNSFINSNSRQQQLVYLGVLMALESCLEIIEEKFGLKINKTSYCTMAADRLIPLPTISNTR